MTGPSTELRVPSLVEALSDAVESAILTGEIQPDTPLTEVGLATQYNVARPTAKAAMERLVHQGLLRRANNKSARVPLLGADDIRDLYQTRSLLESAVAVELAKVRRVPDAARVSLAALRSAAAGQVITQVVESDVDFHRALVGALGRPRLYRLHGSLMGEVHLCMAQVQTNRLLHPATIAEEHAGILDAIALGDETTAAARVHTHLEAAMKRLVWHLAEQQQESHLD